MKNQYLMHVLLTISILVFSCGCANRPPPSETERIHMAKIENELLSIQDQDCAKFKCRYLLEKIDETFILVYAPFSAFMHSERQQPIPDNAALETQFLVSYPGGSGSPTGVNVIRLRNIAKIIPLNGSRKSGKASEAFLLQ